MSREDQKRQTHRFRGFSAPSCLSVYISALSFPWFHISVFPPSSSLHLLMDWFLLPLCRPSCSSCTPPPPVAPACVLLPCCLTNFLRPIYKKIQHPDASSSPLSHYCCAVIGCSEQRRRPPPLFILSPIRCVHLLPLCRSFRLFLGGLRTIRNIITVSPRRQVLVGLCGLVLSSQCCQLGAFLHHGGAKQTGCLLKHLHSLNSLPGNVLL